MRSPYFPARSVLFHKEANGVTYRVPALLYVPRSSSFLAFCEERLSPSDSQAHLLVMRRGTFYRNYVEWEDMRVVGTAFLAGHRSMNPCPVYDEFTGTLFLFFIAVLGHTSESYQLVTGKNVTRLCYVSSTDNGDTWGPVTDLTKQVIGDTIKDWATFALGPGHGIQLKSGRLLIPAYAYHIDCKQCFGQLSQTTPRAFCFHSDTHGRTWQFGEAVPGPESVECQMVSVDEEDGTNVLYCNARSPLGCRVQALSLDDGAVFQEGQLVQRLVEPRNGCHGSIVGFPAPIHLCHPDNHHFSCPLHLAHTKHWTSFMKQPSRSTPTTAHNTTANNITPIVSHTSSRTAKITANSSCSNSIQDSSTASNINTTTPTITTTPAQSPSLATTHLSPNRSNPQNFLTPTWVVYSHPTWPNSRKDLGVFLSLFPRDPDSWSGPWVIYEGPSAYSDLAYMELSSSPGAPPAVAFACLFECGTRTAYDEISFSIFTLYELIDNLPQSMPFRKDNQVSKSCQKCNTHTQVDNILPTGQSCRSRNDKPDSTRPREQCHWRERERHKLRGLCSVS